MNFTRLILQKIMTKKKLNSLGKLIYSFNHHKMITIVSTLFFFDTSKVKLKGKKR
jgi:hypothetical protein